MASESFSSTGQLNKAQTVVNSARLILSVALGFGEKGHLLRKLKHGAKTLQKVSTAGGGHDSMTIDLKPTHLYFANQLQQSHGDVHNLDEKTLRSGVAFFIQMICMGRAQDPYCLLDGIETYPEGCSTWADVPIGGRIGLRLYDTKDTKIDCADREAFDLGHRKPEDIAHGSLSSRFWIHRVQPPVGYPDYWLWTDLYKQLIHGRTRSLIRVNFDKGDGKGSKLYQLPRFFTGVAFYKGKDVQSNSLNGTVNRILVTAGSVVESRKDKSKHIRHSMITMVLTFAQQHFPDVRFNPFTVEALLRSRNALATAESHYKISIHPNTMARISSSNAKLSLDEAIYLV
jgi:hypothetical protein